MTWLWVAFAMAVGCLLAVQPPLNAEAGRHLGGPIAAAALNFITGLAVLILILLLRRGGLPELGAVRAIPWWGWCGGLIGAGFVATAAFLTPRIGVATLIASILCGQLAASLIIDHFGLFHVAIREVSLPRLTGVVMAAVGVILVTRY